MIVECMQDFSSLSLEKLLPADAAIRKMVKKIRNAVLGKRKKNGVSLKTSDSLKMGLDTTEPGRAEAEQRKLKKLYFKLEISKQLRVRMGCMLFSTRGIGRCLVMI
jgi:hypothetical protein